MKNVTGRRSSIRSVPRSAGMENGQPSPSRISAETTKLRAPMAFIRQMLARGECTRLPLGYHAHFTVPR